MSAYEPTDVQLDAARDIALAVWQGGSNDDVWTAAFEPHRSRLVPVGVDFGSSALLAAELHARIAQDPTFTVGDLTQEQALSAIARRYPYLCLEPR